MTVTCVICGTAFVPRRPKNPAKTCSRACTNKMVWRENPHRDCGPKPKPRFINDCAWCGKPVKWARRPGRQGIYCSRACTGYAKSKGGITIRKDGRARIICRDGSRVYYYRAVMENVLGRPLREDEEVHHINGDPTDDRPENLMVVGIREHRRIHADKSLLRALQHEGAVVPQGQTYGARRAA